MLFIFLTISTGVIQRIIDSSSNDILPIYDAAGDPARHLTVNGADEPPRLNSSEKRR